MSESYENLVEGMVTGGNIYASADFPDADEIPSRPPSSVATVVNAVTLHHTAEAQDKSQAMKAWKRKIREIMSAHQERILEFFLKPVDKDHPLRSARQLMNRFSKLPAPGTDWSRNQMATLRDCIVDISGSGMLDLNEHIRRLEELRKDDTPIARWMGISRQLLDYLKDTGDELIRLDQKLGSECSHLDTVVERVHQLVSLPSPDLDGFTAMMEEYLRLQFEAHKIEKIYWDYLNTLQKYSALRDLMTPQRLSSTEHSEPLCPICLTEPVMLAFLPCGHTFCTNCSKRAFICHICRQPVTNRQRLFFG